jgi:hypothetical protein
MDDFDRRLGAMVREAAMTDIYLVIVAQQLCDSPYGALLVAGESSSRAIEVCKTLIDAHTDIAEAKRVELRELLRRAAELVKRRNRYVHGTAIYDAAGIAHTFRMRHHKVGLERAPVDLEDLSDIAHGFVTLSIAFNEWIAAVYGEDQAA